MAARKTLPVTLKRKSVKTRNLRKLLIVCEGKKTEPSYFRAFPDNPEVFDILDIQGMGANTLSLVRKAIELKESAEDRGEPYIEVWVVFDRDEFPLQHFKEAIRLASANNIFCAYSIESFELWFLLHFNYSDSQLSRSDYCERFPSLWGCLIRRMIQRCTLG